MGDGRLRLRVAAMFRGHCAAGRPGCLMHRRRLLWADAAEKELLETFEGRGGRDGRIAYRQSRARARARRPDG